VVVLEKYCVSTHARYEDDERQHSLKKGVDLMLFINGLSDRRLHLSDSTIIERTASLLPCSESDKTTYIAPGGRR